MAPEKPWGKPAEGPTFNEKYPTEFKESGIPHAGLGWWAKVDIPKGTRMRRVSVADGSLVKVGSLEELQSTGWGVNDSVNYGVGHVKDPSAIYFLNPGTACNHADPTRQVSIQYKHDEKDVFELWTTKDITAGDEMFISYSQAFGPCKWFDEFHNAAGRTPLSQLGDIIDAEVMKLKPPPEGAIEMKVSLKKPKGFYVNAALSFLKGVEAKAAMDDKPAVDAKAAVDALRISGTGEAVNVAIVAALAIEQEGIGTITTVQTNYPKISGRACPQILLDIKKK
eukprot:gnl/TRDRNA2_/TRDRNA2_149400_c0_seq1.p1 gnl/TRDRNA2_/TRDRNA2_149400_c0~~gnl/TRDRNA2_/TRDRNA2_149400_c0_seq1.p1  ORF type:complete len:281 (+),score=64.81 gnl/TRDRNA2_/TRDRNA2_149400_c0_seq1:75-917(+)